MLKATLQISGVLLAFGLLVGCGGSSSKKSSSSKIVDFTKFGLLQFKAGNSLSISGSRYDLDLTAKTIKHYEIGTGSSDYTLQKSVTLTSAQSGEINGLLQKFKTQSWGACSAAVCKAGRNSIWVELPSTNPMSYYFSDEGDCVCTEDKSNAPVLQYTQIKAVYDKVIALF